MKKNEIYLYLQAQIKNWSGASVYFRKDWDCYYFDLVGKCFGYYGEHTSLGKILTVKGDPVKNEELREVYPFVIPGYHVNKVHWNTILLDQATFSDEELAQMLHQSYQLVYQKLSKKLKEEIEGKDSQ